MTQQSQPTPKELRHKWIIGLESGFFKPDSTYLRVLSTTNYTYTHSPLGVLCAVSNLGDFVPEQRGSELNSTRKVIRHIFVPFGEASYLPAATSHTRYDTTVTPPTSLLEKAGLVSTKTPTWWYHDLARNVIHRGFIGMIRGNVTELNKYADPPYSIDSLMRHPEIPPAEKFPLLGKILRHLETTNHWYAN